MAEAAQAPLEEGWETIFLVVGPPGQTDGEDAYQARLFQVASDPKVHAVRANVSHDGEVEDALYACKKAAISGYRIDVKYVEALAVGR